MRWPEEADRTLAAIPRPVNIFTAARSSLVSSVAGRERRLTQRRQRGCSPR